MQDSDGKDMELIVKICLHKNGKLPMKGRPADVGYDLTAQAYSRPKKGHKSLQTFMIDFAISVEPPSGYYFELMPRSSLAWSGFIMPNSVGVIDPDYRGTLQMPLVYLGAPKDAEADVKNLIGKRIAQLVLRHHHQAIFVPVKAEELTTTFRGKQGFGSSGQ